MKKLVVLISIGLLAMANVVEAGEWKEVRVCNETFTYGGALAIKVLGYDSSGSAKLTDLNGTANHPCSDFYYDTDSGTSNIKITGVETAQSGIIIHAIDSDYDNSYDDPNIQSVCDVRNSVLTLFCHGWKSSL